MVGTNKDEKGEVIRGVDESEAKWTCPPIRNVTHPLRYYEFTQDEIKALEECDRESFYQRCLPFSMVFAALTYCGVQCGYLRRSPHFGVLPKVILGAFAGHCYGRLSYIKECEIKLRQLPNDSHLGNVMREYHVERNPSKDPKK